MSLQDQNQPTEQLADSNLSALSGPELRKRQRERRIAFAIAVAFIIGSILQALIADRRQTYGFINSLLFFGLLHFNVILIMLLVFLIVRNLVKAYVLRKSGTLGGSLRWRMISSLLFFSLVPSILLFVGSSYIIRQGFDRWFGTQVGRALEDSEAITKVHYDALQSNLGFFSNQVVEILKTEKSIPKPDFVKNLHRKFPVDALEIYSDPLKDPERSLKDGLEDWFIPRAAMESLDRAFKGESFHLIRHYGDGDLVQYYLPIKMKLVSPILFYGDVFPTADKTIILVLSQTVPLGLKTRIFELQNAFREYKRTALFKDSLKTNYTLILLTLFVLVIFAMSWFGLSIARSVTDPVAELLKGTEAFRRGRWNYRIPTFRAQTSKTTVEGAAADLDVLKGAFNLMAEEVGKKSHQIEEANEQLTSLVHELEEREKYLETLLSSIRRGVLVLDTAGKIGRVNQEALSFSAHHNHAGKNPQDFIGVDATEIFQAWGPIDELRAWLETVQVQRGNPVDRIFEVEQKTAQGSSLISVRATGIWLVDERKAGLGWLIILEDVTDAARLERLAAWQEVARRVAHEIKNPLTPIQISTDRLQRRMGERMSADEVDGPVFNECVQQIQKQVRVIRDLVREFSQFAKLPEPKFIQLNLNGLLGEIVKDYRFTHPQVHFELNADTKKSCIINADPEYIRRLVVNLADNAIHSMEEAKVAKPELKIRMDFSKSESNFISVEFTDNGPGVPAHLRDKIFDPYVSSKASGLGLGLPIVRRIAIEHSGRVRCESGPGGRFVLELPLLRVEDVVGTFA